MKMIPGTDTDYKLVPDMFDLATFHRQYDNALMSRLLFEEKLVNGGRRSGVEDAIKAELIEFGFADTDAAMRQLDFFARKMVKERQSALDALARLLCEERARLEDDEQS